MLHHIVLWTLKDFAEGADRATNAHKAKALLESCSGLVPGIERFEVATAQSDLECGADLVLNSSFTDRAALAAYQSHPKHMAIKPFMKAVVAQRQCMDYEN